MSVDMRQKTRELEYEEKRIRNAESAMRTIRLGYYKMEGVVGAETEPPKPKRSWFKLGFSRDAGFKEEHALAPEEVDEVYLALQKVKSEHVARASALAEELGTKARY